MKYFVRIGNRTAEVDLTGATPVVDGVPMAAEMVPVQGTGIRHLLVDGRSFSVTAEPADRRGYWRLGVGARRFTAEVVDERTRAIREMTGADAEVAEKNVTAPMPGLVVKIEVAVGDRVSAGQGVVIVEAMKMENELKAPTDGLVTHIDVEPGQTVERGSVLIRLE